MIQSDSQSFLIPETRPVSVISPVDSQAQTEKPDEIAQALKRQQGLSSPNWQGKEVQASVGESVKRDRQTVLGFSVLNRSKRVIELLPPQLELGGVSNGKKKGQIKAEPVAIAEYRMTARRLEPGQRADGVVVFERPAFKESSEILELELAEADQVDKPIALPVPFTADSVGGQQ